MNEVQYLLGDDFIEPSQSNWSSACLLVTKPDQSYRMCSLIPSLKPTRFREPLTQLIKKTHQCFWSDDCEKSFIKLKAILKSSHVLRDLTFILTLS